MHALIYDRLLYRPEPEGGPDNGLHQFQNEIGFRINGIELVVYLVGRGRLHGVDVNLAPGNNADHLPAEQLSQGSVFVFRIDDHNVCRGFEKDVEHFHLGRKGLARAGRAENKPVEVVRLHAVVHNEVFGNGVAGIVDPAGFA